MYTWVGAFFAARPKVIDDLVLGFSRRNIERPVEPDFLRQVRKQVVERIHSQHAKHLAALDIGLWKIAHGVDRARLDNARAGRAGN
jgi:hypothetical protein